MENKNQKQAIIDVISLLQKNFGIKTEDKSVAAQQIEIKNDQFKERENKLQNREKRLQEHEGSLNDKFNEFKQTEKKSFADVQKEREKIAVKFKELSQRSTFLDMKEEKVREQETKLNKQEEEYKRQLENISQITSDEAAERLCQKMESEARFRSEATIKQIINETNMTVKEEARNILTYAVQKESSYITGKAVSTIDIPDDAIKGKIIGREGRNIRTFEELTGVNILVDDTPGSIVLSCYEPFRREVAKLTMVRLIEDGRIHPKRIEEIFEWATKELDSEIIKVGREALSEFHISNVHAEIVKMLGKLKYRTSYSQNVLDHSKEVAKFAGNIAASIEFDKHNILRASLLHDIGKSVDRDVPGTHAELGAEFAQNFGESKEICTLISEHHDDKPSMLGSWIISAADSLSAGLPGARSNTFDAYVKRIEELENVTNEFTGIKSSYAISAGRELRVVVEPNTISDSDAGLLVDQIIQKIEKSLQYPGQITVTLIRENRFIKHAM